MLLSVNIYNHLWILDSLWSDQQGKLFAIGEKLQHGISLQKIVLSSKTTLNEDHINQSGNAGECPKSPDKMIESGSSASALCTGSTLIPDFSKLQGEISLDKLSIRELHEVFKATFGRETTVKDKLWLKRRIAMGLTNSCDVSTTTFMIKDNKLVKKDEEECSKNVDGSSIEVPAVEATVFSCKDSPTSHSSQMEDHQTGSGKKLRNHSMDLDSGSEHLQTEQRAAKRVRKPTKRYIEELSEGESRDYSQRLMTSPKSAGLGQSSPRSCVRPVRNVPSDGRTVVTRLDSLGGSGVQVPYVSRVRRSRPRKNVMALMVCRPFMPELFRCCFFHLGFTILAFCLLSIQYSPFIALPSASHQMKALLHIHL